MLLEILQNKERNDFILEEKCQFCEHHFYDDFDEINVDNDTFCIKEIPIEKVEENIHFISWEHELIKNKFYVMDKKNNIRVNIFGRVIFDISALLTYSIKYRYEKNNEDSELITIPLTKISLLSRNRPFESEVYACSPYLNSAYVLNNNGERIKQII